MSATPLQVHCSGWIRYRLICCATCSGSSFERAARAIRDIEPGELLTASYLDPHLLDKPVAERRSILLEERHFHCQCQRCEDESAEKMDKKQKKKRVIIEEISEDEVPETTSRVTEKITVIKADDKLGECQTEDAASTEECVLLSLDDNEDAPAEAEEAQEALSEIVASDTTDKERIASGTGLQEIQMELMGIHYALGYLLNDC